MHTHSPRRMIGRRRATPVIALMLVGTYLGGAGCMTTEAVAPLAEPFRRVEVPGLSVLPPPGGNWHLVPVSPQEGIAGTTVIRFGKKLPAPGTPRMVYAGAVALGPKDRTYNAPGEFLAEFKRGFETGDTGGMLTGRQRLIAFDAALDSSRDATCARYSRLTEFRDPQMFHGTAMSVQTHGLFCLHPHWPRYAINMVYTQMYARGQQPLELDAESQAFLGSPIFTSAEPVPPVRSPW